LPIKRNLNAQGKKKADNHVKKYLCSYAISVTHIYELFSLQNQPHQHFPGRITGFTGFNIVAAGFIFVGQRMLWLSI
jgi:hypothetical protein